MGEEDLIKLSEEVGRVHGISPCRNPPSKHIMAALPRVWLHEDPGRCLTLAANKGLSILQFPVEGYVKCHTRFKGDDYVKNIEDFQGNVLLATCVAILECLTYARET